MRGDGFVQHRETTLTRYKGQLKASRTEQEFPYHVEIIVPPGGLGTRLDQMYDFHAQHDIKPQRGQGRHDADGSVIRWCFADASLAEAFATKFATTLATSTSHVAASYFTVVRQRENSIS